MGECPYVVTSDEGTSFCTLAEALDARWPRLLAAARSWRAVRAEGGDPRRPVERLLLAIGEFDDDAVAEPAD